MNEKIENLIQQVQEVIQERNTKHYAFLRHILLMASGLFGVLVSFHSKVPSDQEARYCFLIALGTLGLGILFGSCALYSEVFSLKRLQKDLTEEGKCMLREDRDQQNILLKPSLFFRIVELACYTSFFVSIGMLIAYSFFSFGFTLHL